MMTHTDVKQYDFANLAIIVFVCKIPLEACELIDDSFCSFLCVDNIFLSLTVKQ